MVEHIKQSELVAVIQELRQLAVDTAFKTDDLSIRIRYYANNPDEHMDRIICALRGSYAFRRAVPDWNDIVAGARDIIVARGRNPDTLLAGL